MAEGTYLRLRGGVIVSKATFTSADRRWSLTAQERQALGV